MGDGHCISIIDGANLAQAMKVIEENYGKYSSIKTCRATVDENGNLQEEEEKALYEISNYSIDQKQRKRCQGK